MSLVKFSIFVAKYLDDINLRAFELHLRLTIPLGALTLSGYMSKSMHKGAKS
jgi:hypothetical protein